MLPGACSSTIRKVLGVILRRSKQDSKGTWESKRTVLSQIATDGKPFITKEPSALCKY